MKNPHTSICQPVVPSCGFVCSSVTPRKKITTASTTGTRMSKRSSQPQLRELHEIAHAFEVGREAFLRQEPAHVRAHEAVLHGGVHVCGLVGMRVMMAMMSGPPHGPPLHGRGAEHAEDELADARSLERAMREVAVVERRDGEHAQQVEHDSSYDSHRAPPHPDHGEAHEMHDDERQNASPVDSL